MKRPLSQRDWCFAGSRQIEFHMKKVTLALIWYAQ